MINRSELINLIAKNNPALIDSASKMSDEQLIELWGNISNTTKVPENTVWGESNTFGYSTNFEHTQRPEAKYSQAEEKAMVFLGSNTIAARKSFNTQVASDGVIADGVNLAKEIFNTEYARSNVDKQIKGSERDLLKLESAARGEIEDFDYLHGNVKKKSFSTVFKETRGVEFSQAKIEICEKDAKTMVAVQSATDTIDKLKNHINKGLDTSGNDLSTKRQLLEVGILKTFTTVGVKEQSKIDKMLEEISNENGFEYKLEITKKPKDSGISGYRGSSYYISRMTPSGNRVPATDEQLDIVGREMVKKLDIAYGQAIGTKIPDKATDEEIQELNQKKYNEYKNTYLDSFENAYGKKEVKELAQNYIISQQKGESYVETGVTVTALAGALFTGGGSLAMVSGGVLLTNPTKILEDSTDSDGLTQAELTSWGKNVAINTAYMATGAVANKVGQVVKATTKAGKIASVAQKTNQNPTQLSRQEFANINRLSKAAGISTEVAADMLGVYALNGGKADEIDLLMSVGGALVGAKLQNKIAPMNKNEQIKYFMKEFNCDAKKAEVLLNSSQYSYGKKIAEDINLKLETCQDPKIRQFIEKEMENVQFSGKEVSAINKLQECEALLDAYNVHENHYSLLKTDSHNFIKELQKGENKNEAKADIISEKASKPTKNTSKPQTYESAPFNQASTFKNDVRNQGIKNFITEYSKSNSEMANHLYNNYYLKGLKPEAQEYCKKISKEFNTKLFLEDEASPYASKAVYEEFAEWKKVSKGDAKYPTILDTSSNKKDFINDNHSGIFNKERQSISINGDALSNIQYTIRHEMLHQNDKLKNFKEIDFKSFGTDNTLKQELANAGIDEHLQNYAMKNREEFIAVASTGDCSKYSAAFKRHLVDVGMPKYALEMKTPKQLIQTEKGWIPTFKGVEKINADQHFDIAYNLDKVYAKTLNGSKEATKSFEKSFKDIPNATLSARVKGKAGMQEKLYRKIVKLDERINEKETLLTNASPEQKPELLKTIEELKMLKTSMTSGYSTMDNTIADAFGTRLILNDASAKNMNKVVDKLLKGIENNEFVMTELNNYAGKNEYTYFTKEQEKKLKLACARKGIALEIISPTTNPKEGIKASGYTSSQVNIVYKNGVIGELQIRGNRVHNLAESEHILYDIREQKNIAKGDNKLQTLIDPIESAVKELDKPENKKIKVSYDNYIKEYYFYARELELGKPTEKPNLPTGVSKVLDMENIIALHEKIIKL